MLRNGCFSSIIARRSKKIEKLFFAPPATAKMGPYPLLCVVRIYINTWKQKKHSKDKNEHFQCSFIYNVKSPASITAIYIFLSLPEFQSMNMG